MTRQIANYNKAIELDADYATAYYNRGLIYYYKRVYDSAIKDFNEAIELKPDFVVAYNNRGFAYNNMGKHDKAIAEFTKAIEIDPDYAVAYNNRGNLSMTIWVNMTRLLQIIPRPLN